MGRILERPKVTYVALVVLAVGLFALSAVGQDDGSSVSWIGAIGWFGFLISMLAIVLFTVTLLVRSVRSRGTTA
jgi:hypothetical protein